MSVAFHLALLAATQGVAVSNSPPPAIVAAQTSAAPPIIASPGDRWRDQAPTVVPVRVRVIAGNETLFDDTLRLARNGSANFNQSRNEAPEQLCPGSNYHGGAERQSLSVQLHLRETSQSGPGVSVSVNWQRPSTGASCGADGSRTVALSETVPLAPGQSATLRGDAGLVVTISR